MSVNRRRCRRVTTRPADGSAGRVYRLADLRALPRWFPATADKIGLHHRPEDGSAYGWRAYLDDAITPEGVDKVRAAVEGCRVRDQDDRRWWRIYPQRSYADTLAICRRPAIPQPCEPALSLSATDGYRYPMPLSVLDVDYQPSSDADGVGLGMRDWMRARLSELGCLLFPGRNGNGFHAVFLWPDAELQGSPVRGRKSRPCEQAPDAGNPRMRRGLKFDWFLPGALGLVVLQLDLGGYPDDTELPVVSGWSVDVLLDQVFEEATYADASGEKDEGEAAQGGEAELGPEGDGHEGETLRAGNAASGAAETGDGVDAPAPALAPCGGCGRLVAKLALADGRCLRCEWDTTPGEACRLCGDVGHRHGWH